MLSPSSYETIRVDRKNQVVQIRLNRPESFNAINSQLVKELHHALLQLESDASVRCVLLTGEGKAFCSGGDVKNFSRVLSEGKAPQLFHELPTLLHDMILTMKGLCKPVLAAVNGPAVGAGFSLAVAADLIVASENAYFSLGYLKIGLSPDGSSTFFLPRMVGLHKAFELLTLSEKISASEAQRLGFVSKVFPEGSFWEKAEAFAEQLAQLPTLAVGEGKRLLNESHNHTLASQLHRETEGIKKISQTKDFLEGVTAFVEKRAPKFKGE